MNNEITNLKWDTQSDNIKHAHLMNLVDQTNKIKPVSQFDLNQKFIAEYKSMSHAYKLTRVSITNICSVCNGRRKTAGKFIWSYTNKKDSLEMAKVH